MGADRRSHVVCVPLSAAADSLWLFLSKRSQYRRRQGGAPDAAIGPGRGSETKNLDGTIPKIPVETYGVIVFSSPAGECVGPGEWQ
jgi:hypothetical protein